MGYWLPSQGGGGSVASVNGQVGIVTLTAADLGAAPINSPDLIGAPTAPTPAIGDNSTLLATTAHVAAKIAALAPGLAPVQSVAGRTGTVTLAGADIGLTAGANGQTATDAAAAFRKVDALMQSRVINAALTTPPATPAIGDCYLVPAGATGAWSGQTNKSARWSGVAWEFQTPKEGWRFWNDATGAWIYYRGAAWTSQLKVGTGAASSSTTTGDLVVVGGLAAAGNSTFGGVVNALGTIQRNGVQVVNTRRVGWALPAGTFSRTTFVTTSVTLPILAQKVAALIEDLHATAGHGLIGT